VTIDRSQGVIWHQKIGQTSTGGRIAASG